jgi:hypothetical protein
MPLSKSDLKTALKTMFTTQPNPKTMAQHFINFANVYDDYAKNAIESGGGNELLSTGKTSFQSTMESYALLPSSLANYVDCIEKACISYWDSSAFKTLIPPLSMSSITSIEIEAMSEASLTTLLLKAINDSNGDPETLATKLSDEIHTNTKTVTVTIKGQSKTVPPVEITLSKQAIS